MNWYYIDGPLRVGPLNETEWVELVKSGKIQPETLVWNDEQVEKWTPYRLMPPPGAVLYELPEVADLFESLVTEQESPEAFAARVADLDYPVDLDRCISRAWGVFKAHFWELVGATTLVLLLIVAGSKIPFVDVAVMMLQGVLMGGLYKIYLQRLRGQPTGFADLFAGFTSKPFIPLVLQNLVVGLVTWLCFFPALIVMSMKDTTLENFEALVSNDPQTALVILLVILTCSIPAVYLAFCWMFSVPLIVDKGMPFWPAMRLSRAKVLQHPWRVGLLSVVAGVFGFSGALGFGIGMLFTLPIYFLIKLSLYEAIFNNPTPSPSADSKK